MKNISSFAWNKKLTIYILTVLLIATPMNSQAFAGSLWNCFKGQHWGAQTFIATITSIIGFLFVRKIYNYNYNFKKITKNNTKKVENPSTQEQKNIDIKKANSLNVKNQNTFKEKYPEKQHDNSKIMIYHKTRSSECLNSIKKNGLFSRTELAKRKLAQIDNIADPRTLFGVMDDQYDTIYFSPEKCSLKYFSPEKCSLKNTVGYYVDPAKTYVYNREYRFDNNKPAYNASKILLATYLSNLKQANTLRKTCKRGETVIFDPYSAEPFIVKTTDPRFHAPDHNFNHNKTNQARHYLYLAEIIVQKNEIPPQELHFF